MEPFGKLLLIVMRGKNLKGGQGVFGRADPYVKVILNGKEMRTKTHSQGGKSPVSHSKYLSKGQTMWSSHPNINLFCVCMRRYGMKSLHLK